MTDARIREIVRSELAFERIRAALAPPFWRRWFHRHPEVPAGSIPRAPEAGRDTA